MASPKNRTKQNIIGSIIIGIILIPVGIFFLNTTDIQCGTGQTMHQGDICEATRKGVTTTYTYEERKAYYARMGLFGLAGGVAAFAAAGWFIVRSRRETAAAGTDATASSAAPVES
ncbi:MAG TPA: hypothetical protein VF054_19985 [Micromonosporaceae bacterium]